MKESRSLIFVLGGILLMMLLGRNGSNKMSVDDYVRWVNDPENGFVQEVVIENFKLTCKIQPAAYLALKELRMQGIPFTSNALDSTVRQYGQYIYAILQIGLEKGNEDFLKYKIRNDQDYFDRLKYFTNDVSHDLFIRDNQDTGVCLINHFERSYSVSSYNSMILSFDTLSETDHDKVIVFNDQILGIGKVQFRFPNKIFRFNPTIDFNN